MNQTAEGQSAWFHATVCRHVGVRRPVHSSNIRKLIVRTVAMSRPCRIRVLVLWAAFGCAAALVTAPTASADPVRPSEDRVSNSGRISGATPTVAPAGVRSIRSRALRSAAPAIIACEPITSAVTTPAHARSSRAAPGCSAATRQGSRTTALMTRIAVIVSTQSRPRCQRRSMTATSAPRLKVTSAASGPTIGRSAPPTQRHAEDPFP